MNTDLLGREFAASQTTQGRFRARQLDSESPEALRQVRLAVASAQAGDEEALRFLYVRYANNVYGYVRSMVRDPYEAEDITQQVFAKLMTAIAKYQERGLPFFAWLLRLTRNLTVDHLRAQRLTPVDKVPDGSDEGIDIGQSLTVRAALAGLPADQREVVILRHVLGLTPAEIATRMGRSESSVHGLHHRGRIALKQELVASQCGPSTVAACAVRHLTAAAA